MVPTGDLFMDSLYQFIDLFLHIDRHLQIFVSAYGLWTYLALFLIIFCETGLVVTPFLPGDSLLFAAGAFAATGAIDVTTLFLLLTVAAFLGNMTNYTIGFHFGAKVVTKANGRVIKKEYIERTQAFYARHGGKTIIITRFMPILRTFAPFVAGVGHMRYGWFAGYTIMGAVLWVATCLYSGFFFGNIPIVKANFTLVIFGIIGVSLLPGLVQLLRNRTAKT